MSALFLAFAVWIPILDAEVTAVPKSVVVATSRGESLIPVNLERGHPTLPAPELLRLLPMSASVEPGWVLVAFAGQPFRFLLDAPAFEHEGLVRPLVGGAFFARDTIFLPLQWFAGYIPRVFSEAYHYDPYAARFEEARLTPVITTVSPRPRRRQETPNFRAPSPAAIRSGLKQQHTVVIDPGHGGSDYGNPGLFFPRGVREKHVVLQIAKRLRRELENRGITVIMTRTADALVGLAARGAACRSECDLFASIHVDAVPRRRGYRRANGFTTYFLAEAQTANARRVAEMENAALLYESPGPEDEDEALGFILRDLQENEFLRESAELAQLVQDRSARIHPGQNRGVQQANFAVLREARRPAILIEGGFATNRSDAQFLTSSRGQQRLAVAIAEGIVQYLRAYESKLLADTES